MIATRLVGIVLLAVGSLLPTPLLASSLEPQAGPTLSISPTTVGPGQVISVAASGFTASGQPGAILCLGLLGPDQNVELGRSPAFRRKIGQVTLGPNGTAQTTATMPSQLVAGSYRVVVGGCAPQPDLAPLAARASATLTVVTASPTPSPTGAPSRLPASGDLPRQSLLLAGTLGFLLIGGGVGGRRRWSGRR